MTNRLYRSRRDRLIAGVCGGLGAYFGIDPVLVRVLFAILAVSGAAGVVLYLVLWIIIPIEGRAGIAAEETLRENVTEIGQDARRLADAARAAVRGQPLDASQTGVPPSRTVLAALALIVLGAVMLLANVTGFDLWHLWPLLLVFLGLYLIYATAIRR